MTEIGAFEVGNFALFSCPGSCPQMKFELPDKGAHVMNQEMMYTSEGTNYWWNYTGNYQLDDYKGVWKNEDGDGTNTDMYSRF